MNRGRWSILYCSERVLYWLPRSLGVLFVVYVGILSILTMPDATSLRSLLFLGSVQSIPVVVLGVALYFASRTESVGGVFYIILSVLYILRAPVVLFSLVAPLLSIGLLFLLHNFLFSHDGGEYAGDQKADNTLPAGN